MIPILRLVEWEKKPHKHHKKINPGKRQEEEPITWATRESFTEKNTFETGHLKSFNIFCGSSGWPPIQLVYFWIEIKAWEMEWQAETAID